MCGTVKRALLLSLLTLGLTACPALPPPQPHVTSVDPRPGEAGVPRNTLIRAELSLPSGGLNVTTLDETSVSLTTQGGTPVEATLNFDEDSDTLILDPAQDLESNTGYEFSVTEDLEDEAGNAFQPFTSTFTTSDTGQPQPGVDGLQPDPTQLVFTAGGETSTDTRTLRLFNGGNEAVEVTSLEITGEDAARFSLGEAQTPFTLAPNETTSLTLEFDPSGTGPQLATLVVSSDDEENPQLNVHLGGLGVAGQGGNLEPSLQWIFDTFGFPINAGDDDPSSTPLVDEATNALVGEEVAAQRFRKAGPGPVTLEVLAAFGVENDPVLEFGWYAAGDPSSREQLFEVQQTPTLNAQRLAPEVDGNLSFDPATSTFGFYSFWPSNQFFGQRYVYTEDRLNTFTDAIPHQVRAYPFKNADGEVEPNAYILATEEFSRGFDYNDVVVVVRNVVPVASGDDVLLARNPLGLPYPGRLVLHRIQDTSGRLPPCDPATDPNCSCPPPTDPPEDLPPACDPDWQQWENLVFRDTGTVEVENTSSEPVQVSLSFSAPNDFVLPNGETTLNLQPGESYDLEVQFVRKGPNKGVSNGTLNLRVGDEVAEFELAGVYMRKPEGGREVFLAPLMNEAFGYTTDFGANASGGISGSDVDTPLRGDEVRSAYWERADSGEPVTVTQLAAFHGCCRVGDTFEFLYRGSGSAFGSFTHRPAYGQTIFPPGSGGSEVAGTTVRPNRPFEMRSNGYSSDPSKGRGVGNLGLRFWPLKDRSGQTVPNTYIAAQDNVFRGCGEPIQEPPEGEEPEPGTEANCDYNDNVYLITNIEPAD